MADAQVPVTPSTATNAIFIDNSAIGPTTDLFRQRVVLGDDSSSGRLAQVGSTAPTGTEKALYVRQVGSSGVVLGSVAPSSSFSVDIASAVNLNVSLLTSPISVQGNSTALGAMYVSVQGSTALTVAATTSSVVGLTTTSVMGLTTTSVVGLSSGTAQIGILGPSSGNVIGTVAQSSNWNLSTGAVVGLTTTSVVGLTTTSQVALTSGTLTLGTLTTGTVVGLTTTAVVGLSTAATNTVSLSTANVALIISQTSAGAVGSSGLFAGGGIVATAAGGPVAQTSGMIQGFMVDRVGAQVVNLEGPRQFIKTANLVTASNTSQQQIIPALGAGLVADIVAIEIFSTASSTTITSTKVTFYSSSGQADPGVWNTYFRYWFGGTTQGEPISRNFPIPLTQLTANNPWFVTPSSSGALALNISVQYVIGTS